MYYPYLRGKQFELIALKEATLKIQHFNTKTSPIIEPVKENNSLEKCLVELANKNINFTVIINPIEGDLKLKTRHILGILNTHLTDYNNFQIGVIINNKTKHSIICNEIKKFAPNNNKLSLLHFESLENIEDILKIYDTEFNIINNIIYLGTTTKRYHRNFKSNTLVEIDDYFQSKEKNKDYLNVKESEFSEENLFFKSEGYKGFGDFLTIGIKFSEGVFLPFAIAIYITFIKNKKLRIRHFVSDSNIDTSDIAGKFAEALQKLVDWCNANKVKSIAIGEFNILHNTGHFPGLGTIKKLSILNHFEQVIKSF
jgi:hypothetical protein